MNKDLVFKCFAGILVALSLVANIVTLKDGHNWGDDFAQYILNAQNIAQGKPYGSGIMLENPTIYPPGFSLILAPVVKMAGVDFPTLKFLNLVFWYLALFFLYHIFSRHLGAKATLGSIVFLAWSSFFFVYKQNVLSDIPFFCLICWAFFAFERYGFSPQLMLIMSAALWVRSAGGLLFGAAVIYFLLIERDARKTLGVLLVFALNEWCLYQWMGYHPGFLTTITGNSQIFLHSVLTNFSTAFRSLWYLVCPGQTLLSGVMFKAVDTIVAFGAPIIYVLLLVGFLWQLLKRKLSFLECFSFLYVSFFIFWSGFYMPPDAFTRFILPLAPIVFISAPRCVNAAGALRPLARSALRIVFLVLLGVNVSNIYINWAFNDDMIGTRQTREMAAWVKDNLGPQEHFMFSKPRALALLTGRVGTAPIIYSGVGVQQIYKRSKDLHIPYLVLFRGAAGTDLLHRLEQKGGRLELAWENGTFSIFKMHPGP